MTAQPSYPGYATPTFKARAGRAGHWLVIAEPWNENVGFLQGRGAAGMTAYTPSGHYVGLFPDKQAAGEALVRHAGYEVLR